MDAMIGDPMSATSVEAVFEKQPSPEFRELVTPRAMAVAVVLSVVICFVGMRIQMTAGIVPALNMPASILSFFLLKWLIRLLQSCGFPMLPFTRQENMFLLTCIITCLNLALTSGFATNIIGMTSTVARSLADDPDPRDIMDHVMIIDYKLLFPTGTVIAQLINSFHTPEGAYVAKFYFDFSATYIGLGMICPHIVNFGLFFGAIISWGFLYPFLETKRGQWYQTDSPTSLNGQNGYKVFISVTLIITDGMINFLTLITTASINFYQLRKEHDLGLANYFKKHPSLNYDDRKRIEVFLANRIPNPCASGSLYHMCSHQHDCNPSHVQPDQILPSGRALHGHPSRDLLQHLCDRAHRLHGSPSPGAVVASLLASGVIVAALHISSQAMQDLKSGHMTLTSPRAMVTGQIFGVAVGSILCPCVFLAFQSTTKPNAPVGSKQSDYPCPFAGLYRAIGVIGTGGVKELPKHCMTFCVVAFCVTVIIDAVVLVSQKRGWSIHRYIPSMTVIALPFFAGSYFTIDMCVGSLLLLAWTRMNAKSAEMLSSAVAAGLICGEGLFTLPSALLNMFKVQPPMCMKFLSGGEEVEAADSFLNNLGTSRT
ncbi:hypothetical protein OsJ_17815 [Oryza sativa Japonica Group]|uniref:Uncharacterized protein n=1 Tax=Oryza sativa subsp. japonica TaxID=39947 RepID=B9FNH7_ORYSJ|nr:hypothetical protein OsJ_17815 [Oryza sativa Japonica Group]